MDLAKKWPGSAAVLFFEVGDARFQPRDLLGLRLVSVAIVARLRLFVPKRDIAVAAGRGEQETQNGEFHSTVLNRSSISGGVTKPVTRAGPSPGTAQASGAEGCGLSLHGIIST